MLERIASMLIFDAHLDLAMNAMEWNRDLTRPIIEIRARESGMTDKPDRTNGVVNFEEMRKGNIGLCVATLIARYVKPSNQLKGWHSPAQAWSQTQGQLAWYRMMEELGQMVQIRNGDQLTSHLKLWEHPTESTPIGYILSLEGADSILSPQHLESAFAQGLRAVGPAHYGPGTYAQGTDATGGLGPQGKELLTEMQRLGIILDATHLCDDSFWEAIKIFDGPVWASHQNCRKLVAHNRQFSDEQIKVLIERNSVLGAPLDAWMMAPNWKRGQTTPESAGVTFSTMIDHIDHICQLAGNTNHVGIGTDLDGAFGKEQTVSDLETIADLAKLPALFKQRGYTEADVNNIMHGNFLRFLRSAWK